MAVEDVKVRNRFTDLLERYEKASKDPTLLPKTIDRPGVDPSGYYTRLEQWEDISRSATGVARQIAANARAARVLAETQRIADSYQGYDLSGITPRYTGGFSHQTGRAPVAGLPLSNYSRISSEYGPRRSIQGSSPFHTGIDFAAPQGTPVYATHDGYLTVATGGPYGNQIRLRGGGGLSTRYAHLMSFVGGLQNEWIRKGQLIGYVGSSGRATGPHLHYEIFVNGRHVNPRGYLGRI